MCTWYMWNVCSVHGAQCVMRCVYTAEHSMDRYTDAECGWCVCLCSRVYVVCVLCAIAYACTQCVGGCGYMCFVYMSIRCGYINIACMCVGCVPLWHLGLVGQVCVHSASMGRIGCAWYMWVWAHKQDSCLPRTLVCGFVC